MDRNTKQPTTPKNTGKGNPNVLQEVVFPLDGVGVAKFLSRSFIASVKGQISCSDAVCR